MSTHQKGNPPDAPVLEFLPELSHRITLTNGEIGINNDLRRAIILPPKPERHVAGIVLANLKHQDERYMVVQTPQWTVAVKLDVRPVSQFDQPLFASLEAVEVETTKAPENCVWLLSSSADGGNWILPEDQLGTFDEELTASASAWIGEIEKSLTTFPDELEKFESLAYEETDKLEMNNMFNSVPLTRKVALLQATAKHFGEECSLSTWALANPDWVESSKMLWAQETWQKYRKLSKAPARRAELEQKAGWLLHEYRETRRRLQEAEHFAKVIKEGIKDAPGLIAKLKPLGDALVTMRRSKIQKFRCIQIPRPVQELTQMNKLAPKRGMRF